MQQKEEKAFEEELQTFFVERTKWETDWHSLLQLQAIEHDPFSLGSSLIVEKDNAFELIKL